MLRRFSRVFMIGDNGEFYFECKVVYFFIYDSVKDEIDFVEDLV